MSDSALRNEVTKILREGLKTYLEPIPKDTTEFNAIISEIKEVKDDRDRIKKTLVIAGFIDKPHNPNPDEFDEPQRCLECMYYSVHKRWCEIPEISLPAEDEWWCRLWRI